MVFGRGTSYASPTLAVETIARQPALSGTTLRDALIGAARSMDKDGPPVARVVIPH
jgi:hypothetical protein